MSGRQPLEPRKQPKQIRAELTRQRILAAAARVFAEYGYAAGTTNRIAEEARISVGSLYQYYPNKDAILLELVNRHLHSGEAELRRRQAEEAPVTLEQSIRVSVRAAVRSHLDDPQLLQVMADQAPNSPELQAKMAAHEQEWIAHTRDLLGTFPEVRVGNLDVAVLIVVTTIETVVHRIIATHQPIDLDAFEDELVAMLTRYLTG